MYEYVWNSPQHGQIPCSVQRRVCDQLVVRAADPFDKGEVEFPVPESEVVRCVPQEHKPRFSLDRTRK